MVEGHMHNATGRKVPQEDEFVPGVSYDWAAEELFVDVAKFLAVPRLTLTPRVEATVLFEVVRLWRKAFPNRHVRFYSVRGAV
jgi:hypothetical protein